MKTAQEIAETIGYYLSEKGEVTSRGAEMIKDYAKRKCEEQRELCAEFDGVDIDHTNYPEPNFDK